MRRNKFINYPIDRTESCLEVQSNDQLCQDEVLTDQIYYPILRFDKLRPY